MMRKLSQIEAYSRRLRLSQREIAAAMALTLAAVAFLTAALTSNVQERAEHSPIASTQGTKTN
jgi:hypothetical protein